ncbi:MAG TPA: hypothetical protein VMU54_04800 [Planctomycetota bacterium]|nr:hypothetical protein [Planctomycetota bacterium]
MNCQDYRDRVTVHLADGSETPGDHGDSCAECGRFAELARAAWEVAGRDPDQPVPGGLVESLLRSCRRPRRTDLTLLRPGAVAAAAVLAVAAILLFWPAKAGPGTGLMMDSDGMSVERYDLPAGAKAEAVAEEIRKTVAPETWGEGVSGLEVGDGYLRVRGPAEVQRAVREFLERHR